MIYIGHYDLYDSSVKRSYATSAVNKIRYMLKSFSKAYEEVCVFSFSKNIEETFRIYPSELKNEGKVGIYFPLSWGGKGKVQSFSMIIWLRICLFLYLLKHAHENEHVYVYHATAYGKSILWAKAIKKFKLILEVEEIYSDVQKTSENLRKYEFKYINKADAYIFSTNMLNEKINKINKPYIVINGTYEVEDIISEKFNDGKIHVVYAGTFDIRKGSAAAAAAAAEYLNKDYVLHICGFGSEKDKTDLLKIISQSNAKNDCKIEFHGLLTGREYISFLQKCHIGLSTQNPNASFNATSFPSKILSYLANGLSVVSIRIPAIETSSVGKYVTYYDEQTPSQIADAIMNANIETNYRSVISKLSDNYDNSVVSFRKILSCN